MKSLRRSLRALGLVLLGCHAISVCEAQTPPVRIMPLGDSLTSGTTVQGAYRNKLYALLTAAGYNVDFVGTQTDTNNPTLPDRNHQGEGGFRIDQIQSGLSTWLNAIEDPDVVLLMIGTNDFSQNFNVTTAQNRLTALVSDIAAKRPFAKIILANLPLRTDDPALESLQAGFNASIPALVNNQVALGHQVSFVDMHSALVAGDLVEGVHPSVTGYEKLAAVWFPAITSVITPLGTANPPAIAGTGPAVDLQHVTVKFSKPLADSAASLTNFVLDGGVTISQALLDPVTKRTITLTTSTQTAGKLYTLTVNGVFDRTPAQHSIAAGSTVPWSAFSLVNGSFESGEAAWTMTGNRLNYASDGSYVATDGTQMMVLNGGNAVPNATLLQTFPTVPGQYYVLAFDVGVLSLNAAGQQLGVSVTGASALLSRTESVFGNGLGTSAWSSKAYAFTADGTSATLAFQDQSATSDGLDLLLDNVRVTATAPPVNTAPVAAADSYSTSQGIPLTVPAAGVLANDSDAQSNTLSAILNAGPAHGTVILNADGGFTYTPAAGYTGPDSFTYHANDGNLNSNIATVSITVNAVAVGSLVNGSFESGETGWTMTGNRLVYQTDGTYVATDPVPVSAAHMLVLNGGPALPNAVVTQTFATAPGQTYNLTFDIGALAINTGEQKLQVDISAAGAAPASLLSAIASVSGNGTGTSSWTAKSYSFVAAGSATSLTFTDISSTTAGIDLLLDNVKITASGNPPNTAPVAAADSYTTNQNTALVIPSPGVLANDTDAQSNILTAVPDTGPAHGGLTLNSNGSFTYTPASGYTGADSFTYHASDGGLNSNIATVSITVTPPVTNVIANGSFESNFTAWTASGNQSIEFYPGTDGSRLIAFNGGDRTPNAVLSQTIPTVVGKTYTLSFDMGVLSYVQRQQILEVAVTGAGSLLSKSITLKGDGNGSIVWSPRSYTFVANSTTSVLTFRDRSSSTAGLDLLLDNVRVNGPPAFPNGAPVAVADAYSTNHNTTLVIAGPGVLANDTDPQANALTAVLETSPAHGILSLGANGGFSYTPATAYAGADSFTYHANDGGLNSNTVTVSLTVNAPATGLLVNPSFEDGFSGWITAGNQSIEFYPTTDGIRMVAFNGKNLTPNAALSQTFATTAGRSYTITFDAGTFSYTTDAQVLQVTATGNGGLLSQTVTLNGQGGGAIRWLPQTLTFTANSANTTLAFRDQSVATVGIDLLLDNIRVTTAPLPVLAAPLPAPTISVQAAYTRTGANSTISLTAPIASDYNLERSTDLVHWEIVNSVQKAAGQQVEFHESATLEPGETGVFYRIGYLKD